MSGRTLEIVLSVWAVWGLAHGLKALRHWKTRDDMTLALWQGGLMGQGKVIRGASLWVLGWANLALVAAVGMWIGGVVPFEVGRVIVLALCVPGIVITATAKRPPPDAPEVPEVPRATAVTRESENRASPHKG